MLKKIMFVFTFQVSLLISYGQQSRNLIQTFRYDLQPGSVCFITAPSNLDTRKMWIKREEFYLVEDGDKVMAKIKGKMVQLTAVEEDSKKSRKGRIIWSFKNDESVKIRALMYQTKRGNEYFWLRGIMEVFVNGERETADVVAFCGS